MSIPNGSEKHGNDQCDIDTEYIVVNAMKKSVEKLINVTDDGWVNVEVTIKSEDTSDNDEDNYDYTKDECYQYYVNEMGPFAPPLEPAHLSIIGRFLVYFLHPQNLAFTAYWCMPVFFADILDAAEMGEWSYFFLPPKGLLTRVAIFPLVGYILIATEAYCLTAYGKFKKRPPLTPWWSRLLELLMILGALYWVIKTDLDHMKERRAMFPAFYSRKRTSACSYGGGFDEFPIGDW